VATTTILDLPVATGVDGTEFVPLVQGLGGGAVTKRAQIQNLGFVGATGPTGPTGPQGAAIVNIDGGRPDTNYGGIQSINGGVV
jgi:hypothetical protein